MKFRHGQNPDLQVQGYRAQIFRDLILRDGLLYRGPIKNSWIIGYRVRNFKPQG
jgi:hypothetical protein